MTKQFKFNALIFGIFLGSFQLSAQISTSFEASTGNSFASTACQYTDPNQTSVHILVNGSGCPVSTVTEAATASTLGYSIYLDPTGTGFADGDYFGVASADGLNNELSIAAADGSQAFFMEDIDGIVTMLFSEVDLTGAISPFFEMEYILESTTWEGADFLNISIDITGCPAATSVSVLNSLAADLNNVGSAWNTLSSDLSAYVDCNAQLIVEFSSNSAAEELAIDNISFSQGVLLPIELAQFNAIAIDDAVKLEWVTSSEINNLGFEIQHSLNGYDWSDIAFKESNGNSIQNTRYEYVHNNPSSGYNYYRLKQIDYDGKFEYSYTSVVEMEKMDQAKTRIFPNPVNQELNIVLPAQLAVDGSVQILIYNQLGQIVLNETKSTTNSNIQMNLDQMATGFYHITVEGNGIQYMTKFVKE